MKKQELREKDAQALEGAREGTDLLGEEDAAEQERFTLRENGTPRAFTAEEVLGLAQRCLDGDQALLADTPLLAQLLEAYPDVRELPEQVEQDIRGGMTPLEAYRAYENSELRRRLAEAQQNGRNAAAPGSQAGDADDDALDELMQAFNSVFG